MKRYHIKAGDNLMTRIVNLAFSPERYYRPIQVRESTHAPRSSGWDGGSRTSVCFIEIGETAISMPFNAPSAEDEPSLRPGLCAVDHSTFQGKVMGYTVHLHPDDYKRYVTDTLICTAHEDCRKDPEMGRACVMSGTDPCDERARTILAVYRGYKSSYRPEVFRRLAVKGDEVARLIEAGWLSKNKAGAISITAAGKNICADTPLPP